MIINDTFTSRTSPSGRASDDTYIIGCIVSLPDIDVSNRNDYLISTANDILAAALECPILVLRGMPSFTGINKNATTAWKSGDTSVSRRYNSSSADRVAAITLSVDIPAPLTPQVIEFHITPVTCAIAAACGLRDNDTVDPYYATVIFGKDGSLSAIMHRSSDMEKMSNTYHTVRVTTAVLHSFGINVYDYMESRMTLDTAAL